MLRDPQMEQQGGFLVPRDAGRTPSIAPAPGPAKGGAP
jgi:hypothetical protein